jgi:hypothetical protein
MSFGMWDDDEYPQFPFLGWGNGDDADEDQESRPRYHHLLLIVAGGIVVGSLAIVALYFLAIWLWSLLSYAWKGASEFLAGFPGVVGGVLVILLVAFGLFELRKRARLYYGILEICFALTSSGMAAHDLLKEGSDAKHWIVVGGAIYLFVRGMDNIAEATRPRSLTPEQKRWVVRKLKKWVKREEEAAAKKPEDKSGGN